MHCDRSEILDDPTGAGVGIEIRHQIGIQKNPASAVKAIPEVIDLNRRSRQLAAILHSPGQRIQPSVN